MFMEAGSRGDRLGAGPAQEVSGTVGVALNCLGDLVGPHHQLNQTILSQLSLSDRRLCDWNQQLHSQQVVKCLRDEREKEMSVCTGDTNNFFQP